MRKLSKLGLATLIAAGLAGTAMAGARSRHVMTVPLPDGSVAKVEYAGDVAPKVTVAPVAPLAVAPGGVAAGLPVPALGGLFEQIDRQMAAAMREIDQLSRQPLAAGGVGANLASYGSLPPGTTSYSAVTVSDNGRQCSRSTEVVGQGPGKPPRVISHQSGDCGPPSAPPPAARTPSGAIHES